MQIFVTIPNGRQLNLDVQGADSLESLRKAIHDKFHHAHPHLCTLAMDSKILAEGTLADNGVMLEATIICRIKAEELLVENLGGAAAVCVCRSTAVCSTVAQLQCVTWSGHCYTAVPMYTDSLEERSRYRRCTIGALAELMHSPGCDRSV